MKQRGKVLALLLALCLLVSTIAGCGGGSEEAGTGDTIKIGAFEPLTGANAAGGELELEGMQLANEVRPEVLDKKVELVVADNKSDKAEATTAAARLVEKDKVSAVLGSWGSSLSIAAGDILKQNEVPAVSCSATNPQVTLGNDFYFRVCYLDDFQAEILANYAFKKLGAKKVAIIQEVSNDYSTGLAKFFTEDFKALTGDDGSIVATGNYNTGDTDFNGILTNIKAANPDAIFAPGNYTESALIMKQARSLGITAPFIGADTWETNELIDVGGADVEGASLTTFFDDTNPNLSSAAKEFVDAYREKYPDRQSIPGFTALAYDSYMIVMEAIEKAGSADPKEIQKALTEIKDFDGVTGKITFDENGDAAKEDAVLKKVEGGKFVYQDTVTLD